MMYQVATISKMESIHICTALLLELRKDRYFNSYLKSPEFQEEFSGPRKRSKWPRARAELDC